MTKEAGRIAMLLLGTLLVLGACQEDESVCLEPTSDWEENRMDRDAIHALSMALFDEPAYEMSRANCVEVPVGVDDRNGEPILAFPFCDDDCTAPEAFKVMLFYDAATEADCADLWGCTVEPGALPGMRSACGPEGRLPYPLRVNECLAPCPVPVEGYAGVSLDVPALGAVKTPYADRVVPWTLGCAPAPVGVDARNGAPVFLEQQYEDVLLTYGPASEGDWDACAALTGACTAKATADATALFRCAPLALPAPWVSDCP